MKQLLEITQLLSGLYRSKANIQRSIFMNERDLDSLIVSLTPPDGWDGKNQEQRDLNRQRVLSSNSRCNSLMQLITNDKLTLIAFDGEIAALEVKRKGLEWLARISLAEAWSGKSLDLDALLDSMFDNVPFSNRD